MDSATYDRVLEERVIERDGKLYAWTIPLALPITAATAGSLSAGDEAALVSSKGEVVGTLEVSDVFEWDKKKYLSRVYGTDRIWKGVSLFLPNLFLPELKF